MEKMLFILLTFSLHRSVRCHGNHLELPKRVGIDETEAKQFFSDNTRSKRQTADPYCFDRKLERDCESNRATCANREDTREFLCNMIGTVCLPNQICMIKDNWCPSHFEGKTECADLCFRNGLICKNGGECRSTSLTSFYCTCQAGYTGADCGIGINECTSDPCQSGGLCLDEVNGYSCNCASGYTGTNCQININECTSDPCQSGGLCLDEVNRYRCNCASGYTGTNCQYDINECTSDPCQSGGLCLDEVNRYSCNCASGYTGTNCQININECTSDPCQSGGLCLDEVNRYSCNCASGYTGTNCQYDINECTSDPCQSGGLCLDEVNGYSCNCASGYTGTNCQININECTSDPCQSGGLCLDEVNRYRCNCASGYTGTNCQYDINECTSDPCQSGGLCLDEVNRYSCNCASGYTGTNCQININECTSDPCQSGGLCLDEVNGYSCNCASGYTGTNCQYNRCKSGPANIVFLLDSSFSQGQDNFQKQLEFIKNFTTLISIGQDSVQISVVIISFHAKVEFTLTTYANRNSLLAAIGRIQYDPGATYTGAALQKAREVLQNGRTYVSIDGSVLPVKKRVIVLTDGMASDKVNMKYQASLLRATGVNTVAIGIGSEILHEELLDMASHYSNVFTVSTFDGLNGILSEVGNYLCEACYNKVSDILYLLDGSSSVTLSEFQGALDAMQHLTSLVTLGSNKVRLSLVKYAEEPEVVFDFKKYTSAISIHQELQILYQYPKPANHLKALEYLHQIGFKSTNGARNGVRQVVIWFSNGKGIESSAMDLANKLKNDGKLLVTVGYGSGISKEVMLNITSYPYMFFHLGEDQYTAVTVLNSLKTLFEFNVCNF